MTFLLDVNVLIALIDSNHVAHDAAHEWFEETGHADWATCPLVENGVMRIVGHHRYPGSPGSPGGVATILNAMRGLSGHQFWSDDLSLLTSELVDSRRILISAHVTDTYLLALAKSKGAFLASLDRRMSVAAVAGGRQVLHLIGGDQRNGEVS